MQQIKTNKKHYKMYKKGRLWVVAGITVTAISFSPLLGRADTQSSTGTATAATTDGTQQSSGNTVTLQGQSATTAQAAEETTATQQNDSGTNAAKRETTEPTTSTTQSAPVEKQASEKQSAPVQNEQSTKNNENSSTPTTTASATDQTASAPVDNQQAPVTVNNSVTDQADMVKPVAENTDSKSVVVTPVQKENLARSTTAVEDVITGSIGTSTFTIDEGTLTISGGDWTNGTPARTFYDLGQTVQNSVKKVVITDTIIAAPNMDWTFGYFKKLTEFEGLEKMDTSKTTSMSRMFAGVQVADLSGVDGWDVSNVTNLNATFMNNQALTTIDLNGWDVSKVTNMIQMFSGDSALVKMDLSGWGDKTSNVTSFSSMFSGCTSLQSVNLSGWNVSNVTSTAQMFNLNNSLTSLNLTGWTDSKKLTDTSYMFRITTSLENLDLSGLNMSNVNDLDGMFNNDNLGVPTNFILKSLTLGAQSKLTNSSLPNVPTKLGTWVNKENPNQTYTSAELMALYNGTTNPTDTITWVWEKAPSQSELTAKDVNGLIAGPNTKWSVADSVATLKDADGNDILGTAGTVVKVLSVDGDTNVTTVDTTTAGTYTVVLSYTDATGEERQATSTVTVIENKSQLIGQDTTINMGTNAALDIQAVVDPTSTEANGNQLTADEIATVTATGLDVTKAGAQKVTLTYVDSTGTTRTTEVTVTMVASKASLTFEPSTVIQGPNASWKYGDHLTGATDFYGNAIDANELTGLTIVQTEGQPDLSQLGQQTVTLTYTDELGNVVTATAEVNVVASQIKIETVDQLVVWPDEAVNLTAKDFVTSLTDSAGRPITDFKVVGVSTFDPDKVGPQTITLTYTDEAGNQVTGTTELTVDHAQIVTQDTTPIAGPNAKWDYTTNLKTVTDSKGQPVNLKEADITVLVEPDMSTVSIGLPQTVEFTYTDDLGKVKTVTATVTTVASKANLQVQGGQIVWPADAAKLTANDFVTKITGADGADVTDFSGVTMSAIDPAKAGVQTVTLTYTDAYGNQVTKQTTVTVDQATIETQDTTPIAGPDAQWDYLSNLASVTDANGSPIDAKNATIKVINAPDLGTAKLGIPQTVTFEYTDNLGKTQRVTATVTTVATQATVVGRDQTIVMGPNASWQLSDSLDAAKSLTANGTPMTAPELGQIVSDTQPNLQRAGTYELTLSYVDAAGNLITGHATVTVVASQADLQVKDSQLTAGGQWHAADNFVSAKDANGQPVSLADVTVQGTVDTATPGQYQITYTYTDAAGNVLTKTATVTVLAESVDPDEIDDNNGGTKQPGNNNGNNGGTATQPGGNGEGATIDPGTHADQSRQTNSAATSSASDGVTGSPATTVKPQAGAATTQSALPKTAERSSASTAWGLAGLSLVGLLSALGGTRRRREDQ